MAFTLPLPLLARDALLEEEDRTRCWTCSGADERSKVELLGLERIDVLMALLNMIATARSRQASVGIRIKRKRTCALHFRS